MESERSGGLAQILNEATQTFLEHHVEDIGNKYHYWLGANDLESVSIT